MKRLKENKAITLVALVITIIVLLILAGISIAQLTGNGLFEKAKIAKEVSKNVQEDEEDKIAKYSNEIDTITSNRDSKATYTLLWEGTANTKNIKYPFKDGVGNIDDYDFILIEYEQSDGLHKHSLTLSKDYITKDKKYDIGLWGYGTRYTDIHFTINGFIIDEIAGDNSYYNYPKKVYGIRF